MQANALGATDLLPRPLGGKPLLTKVLGDIEALAGDQPEFTMKASYGASAGLTALQNVFAAASMGAPLNPKTIDEAGEAIVF